MARLPRARAPDAGQAAVEVALALPVVAVLLLAVVQVLVVGGEQVALQHVAREAARAATLAEGSSPVAAGLAAGRAAAPPLQPARLTLNVSAGGIEVHAEARYDGTRLPLVGALLGPIRLEAHAVMHREP
jgi:Flp pilus assembly protein TadG